MGYISVILFFRDAYLICLIDTITSIFAGFVVFTILGVMADETGSDVESVIEDSKLWFLFLNWNLFV